MLIHRVGLADVLGLPQVTAGVLAPKPVQGLRQGLKTQRTLGIRCGRTPGSGGAAHGHPMGPVADRVDIGSLRQTLGEGAGRRGGHTLP